MGNLLTPTSLQDFHGYHMPVMSCLVQVRRNVCKLETRELKAVALRSRVKFALVLCCTLEPLLVCKIIATGQGEGELNTTVHVV